MEVKKLIETYKEDIIKKTQKLIQIKSVEEDPQEGMPFGEGPYRALDYSLRLAEDLGFKTENFDGYAGHADFGQGEETVGILVHLDVVPEGDGWTYDPYGGEIHDGKIYGRGTIDDKGPTIAALYAMKAVKESKEPLRRKIRIIFGTNEESGWGCMKHYFANQEAPTMAFTPDADFPVIHGEKGIIVFDLKYNLEDKNDSIRLIDLKGGSAPNMVADTAIISLEVEEVDAFMDRFNSLDEKRTQPLSLEVDKNIVTIRARGISAHGSTPEKGENAISYLMEALGDLLDESSPLKEFVDFYRERIGFYHYGEKIGCGLEDELSGKLNFNPGLIKYDGNSIVLTINIRYPIHSTAKEVYDGIRTNLQDSKVELLEGKTDQKPLYIPKDNFLVEKLMGVYRKETGDNHSKPITIGGGTYARAMENAVAFGPMFPGQKDVAHQKDEFISIEHLMKISEIYARALLELAR